MDYLYDIFFGSSFENDYVFLCTRIGAFLLAWGILLFGSHLIALNILARDSDLSKDHQIQLSFLWGAGVLLVLFAVYFFFLLRYVGPNIFLTRDSLIASIPVLMVPLITIICYLIYNRQYQRSIKLSKIK